MTDQDRIRQSGQKLAAVLGDIAKQGRPVRGATVPEMAADPSPDSAVNLWLLADGRLRSRTADGTIYQYSTMTPGSSTSGVALPADPELSRFRTVYQAQWCVTFCDLHGAEGTDGHYGPDPTGVHGDRHVMLGFDTAALTSDLAGSVIRLVQIRVANVSAQAPTVTLWCGTHTQVGIPTDFTETRINVWSDDWPLAGMGGDADGWHIADPYFGRAFRDGAATGLTIDQPNVLTAAGQIDWTTAQLAIEYTR
jgi:hypothetical protein